MAASTANQKVFVPLAGVLKVQDQIRNLEQRITDVVKPEHRDLRAKLVGEHRALVEAIKSLQLPVEIREYRLW